MHKTAVTSLGYVYLGDDAESLGFEPGALVSVVRLSTGSFLITLDDTDQLAYESRVLARASARELVNGR